MYNIAIEEWLNEVGDPNVNPSGGPPQVGLGVPPAQEQPTTNNAPDPNAPPPNNVNVDKDSPTQGKGIEKDTKIPDVSQDPQSPDMPKEEKDMAFEEWQDTFFRESTKNDVNKLIDLIHQIRDRDLESYPRKFVEDNLQILFLRQN